MEFFKKINFDFIANRRSSQTISLLLVIASIFLLANKGLNLGLEFTGGIQMELQFALEQLDLQALEEILHNAGFIDVRLQYYGTMHDVLIRLPEQNIVKNIVAVFADHNIAVTVRDSNVVGAAIGEQLVEQGILGILVAIVATMIYIAMRFEYRFAVSAAIALSHDVLIILGAFALFSWEFDLAALAAVLAILGYSLNDTIVVFDRVRENFVMIRKGTVPQIMNAAINQTLSRTIMTSLLTLAVVVSLLVYGGAALFSFSIALCIGIVVGTYSSVFIAGSLAFSMGLTRADLLAKPKSQLHELD